MLALNPQMPWKKLFKIVKLDERYQRLKAGEPQETLLAEAEELYKSRVKDPSTTHVKAKTHALHRIFQGITCPLEI
jgi:hypothetical protein